MIISDDGSLRALVLLACKAKMTKAGYEAFCRIRLRHEEPEELAARLGVTKETIGKRLHEADKQYNDLRWELQMPDFDIYAAEKPTKETATQVREDVLTQCEKQLDGITAEILRGYLIEKQGQTDICRAVKISRTTFRTQSIRAWEILLRVLRGEIAARNVEDVHKPERTAGADGMRKLAESYLTESVEPMERRLQELRQEAALKREQGEKENAYHYRLRVTALQRMVNEMRHTAFICENYHKKEGA